MSVHSYSRCWLHMIWATKNREKVLNREARKKVSAHLTENAKVKEIYMKINYVNAEHIHTLIDLPTKYTIEDVSKLLKGELSYWINQNDIISNKFSWGRGYGAFSVSHSNVSKVAEYIAKQEEHHKKMTFLEEYRSFVENYGLVWFDD